MAQPFIKLLKKFAQYKSKVAFIYNCVAYDYTWLVQEVKAQITYLDKILKPGEVVELCCDYGPRSIACFIALACKNSIIAPLSNIPLDKLDAYSQIIQPYVIIKISETQEITWQRVQFTADQEILHNLKLNNLPGLVIMSSGTTGSSKAIVHNLLNILSSQRLTRSHKVILSLLVFDHIGGINVMLNALVNGNTLVLPKSKYIDNIAKLIESNMVNVLIASPSYLSLMTLQNIWSRFSFTSLKHINYGSEVMSQHLLNTLINALPNTRFSQSYGATEIGVLNTISKDSGSLLVKLNNNYRIVDNKLEIKTNTSMIGYLNAPSPFTKDGWFITGDMVEEHGEWIKILGRESDMINVGGGKVFPIEVENVLLQIPQVKEAVVYSEANSILGNIVKANIFMETSLNNLEKIKLLRGFCLKSLEYYKVPQKFEFVDNVRYCRRHKKVRKPLELLN